MMKSWWGVSVLAAVVIAVLAAGCQPAVRPPITVRLAGQVPADMAVTQLDVSGDRRLALIDGDVTVGENQSRERRSFLVDIERGTVAPVSDVVPGGELPKPHLGQLKLSPDGRYLAVWTQAEDWTKSSTKIIDLSTKQVVARVAVHGRPAWVGAKLFLGGGSRMAVSVYDLATKTLTQPGLYGWANDVDAAGDRLVAFVGSDPTKPRGEDRQVLAVVTPEGRLLRQMPCEGGFCDRQMALISANGKYACAVHVPQGMRNVSARILSVDTGAQRDLQPSAWGCIQALTDRGEPVACGSGRGIMVGREQWEYIVRGGKINEGCLVGEELFYVDESDWTLRSIDVHSPPVPAKHG